MSTTQSLPASDSLITIRYVVTARGEGLYIASGPNAADMLARTTEESARIDGAAYYLATRGVQS